MSDSSIKPQFASAWRVATSEHDNSPESKQIQEGLREHVEAQFGDARRETLTIAAYSATSGTSNQISGGIKAVVHWGWFYITQLWVEQSARRQGLGIFLLQESERLARAKGCEGIYVDTFELRVVEFYKRAGFKEIGRIANFPAGRGGHRTFLAKDLR